MQKRNLLICSFSNIIMSFQASLHHSLQFLYHFYYLLSYCNIFSGQNACIVALFPHRNHAGYVLDRPGSFTSRLFSSTCLCDVFCVKSVCFCEMPRPAAKQENLRHNLPPTIKICLIVKKTHNPQSGL